MGSTGRGLWPRPALCDFTIDICPREKYNLNQISKDDEGDSRVWPNVSASRGRWEPGASRPLLKITPESQPEPPRAQ